MSAKIEKMIRLGGDPILSTVCEPIGANENLEWIDKLKFVGRKHKRCAGLAAPQIGVAKCAYITNVRDRKGSLRLRVFINPKITWHSEKTDVEAEECLSYPGKRKNIRRWEEIEVSYEDEKRQPQVEKFAGFEARVHQHEFDHTQGICRVGDDSPDIKEPEVDCLKLAAYAAAVSTTGW